MILYLAGYKPCAKRWNLDTKDIYLLSSFWEHKSGHYGGYVCQEKHILDSGAFPERITVLIGMAMSRNMLTLF